MLFPYSKNASSWGRGFETRLSHAVHDSKVAGFGLFARDGTDFRYHLVEVCFGVRAVGVDEIFGAGQALLCEAGEMHQDTWLLLVEID